MDEKEITVVDTRKVIKLLWSRKKVFFITLPIAIVLSSLIILCVPRSYVCEIKLAPEYDLASAGNLSSLASQFGLDFGDNPTTDAISPTLYPDLIESTNFLVSLFPIHVESADGEIKTDYFTYLKKYQKHAWWEICVDKIKSVFKKKGPASNGKDVDPFRLTKDQTDIAKLIKKRIKCTVDKKTDVISFIIEDQDALICACMADSISGRLQDFITDYRTSKARNDLAYYKKLTTQAKQEYIKMRQQYASFVDEHTDLILESYKTKVEDMENDLQLKYTTYSTLNTQLQAARAKVQERTPAFTVLQGATVPIKPLYPKRMIFVLAMTLLTAAGTGIYLLRDIIR